MNHSRRVHELPINYIKTVKSKFQDRPSEMWALIPQMKDRLNPKNFDLTTRRVIGVHPALKGLEVIC